MVHYSAISNLRGTLDGYDKQCEETFKTKQELSEACKFGVVVETLTWKGELSYMVCGNNLNLG